MNNEKNTGEGWSSFWIPAVIAFFIIGLIALLAWSETRIARLQIENNVNKSIELQTQLQPTSVPKYDSTTQNAIKEIEVERQMSIDHINNYYGDRLQDLLDSTYNE